MCIYRNGKNAWEYPGKSIAGIRKACNGNEWREPFQTENKRAQYGKVLLGIVQEKAQKRIELAKNISDETIANLLVFREYGNSIGLFSEKAEGILQYFTESELDRNDALKKVEKKDIFKRILYGMRKCGQVTYRYIIKDEFERASKELVEIEYMK